VPIPLQKNTVTLDTVPARTVQGVPMEMEITICVGEVSLKNRTLSGMWVSPSGDRIELKGIALDPASIRQRIWIDSSGLKPGLWNISLWIEGLESDRRKAAQAVEILPSPVVD